MTLIPISEWPQFFADNLWAVSLATAALVALVLLLMRGVVRAARRVERGQRRIDKTIEDAAGRMGEALAEKLLAAIPGEEGVRSVAKDEIARGFVDLRGELRESDIANSRASENRAAEIKRLLSEHAVYLHDRFADIAAREEERLRATRDSAAADSARRAAEDRAESREALSAALKQFSETMSAASRANSETMAAASRANAESLEGALRGVAEAMNRLSAEVDAKLARTAQRVEGRVSENIGDAQKSFEALRERMDRLAEERAGVEEIGRDVAAMSRVMLARVTRGTAGPAQLSAILEGALSPDNFALNAKTAGGATADAVLKLPPPNGDIAMDAGLSLENFARTVDENLSRTERDAARSAFAGDVRKRVDFVADHLIAPGAGGAMLFVAAEAAFAELHAHCRAEVSHAASRRVWLVSPATMLAVLNTARAAVRDYRAREELERLRDGLREVARQFAALERQMAAIGGHVSSAWRGMQGAESDGAKLLGRVRNLADSAAENEALENADDKREAERFSGQKTEGSGQKTGGSSPNAGGGSGSGGSVPHSGGSDSRSGGSVSHSGGSRSRSGERN